MNEIHLRNINRDEADLIEILFQDVYNRKQGREYWKWCFENPYGYLNVGVFENSTLFEPNKLIGYYACHLTKKSGCMVSAMVHPEYRKQGIFMEMSKDLLKRISYFRDWVYLFSNEMIRDIHIKKEGFVELYQVKEYRVVIEHKNNSFTPKPFKENKYTKWRYKLHPLVDYRHIIALENGSVYSDYKDRLQIIKPSQDSIQKIIKRFETIYNKGKIAFWSNKELHYPYVLLPTWKQVKILRPEMITIEEIKQKDQLYMGMSDVF